MSAIHDFRSIMKKYLASANGWLQDAARGFGSNAEHADYKTMDSALEKVAVCLSMIETTRRNMMVYERNAKKKMSTNKEWRSVFTPEQVKSRISSGKMSKWMTKRDGSFCLTDRGDKVPRICPRCGGLVAPDYSDLKYVCINDENHVFGNMVDILKEI